MIRLVLLRHGESAWNKENRFTGWTDVDLSEKGLAEAHEAGKLLRGTRAGLRQPGLARRLVALQPVVVRAAADVRTPRRSRHSARRSRLEQQPALAGRRGPEVGPGRRGRSGFRIHAPIIPLFRRQRTPGWCSRGSWTLQNSKECVLQRVVQVFPGQGGECRWLDAQPHAQALALCPDDVQAGIIEGGNRGDKES